MSSRQYPRIVWNGSGWLKRKTCVFCSARTTSVIVIETSWFRGEDEVYKACKGCQKELREHYNRDDPSDAEALVTEIHATTAERKNA